MTTEQKRDLVVRAIRLLMIDLKKRGDQAPARTAQEAIDVVAKGLGKEQFAQLRGMLLWDVISSIDVDTLLTFAAEIE